MIVWSPGIPLADIEDKIVETAYNFYNKDSEKTASSLRISMQDLQNKIIKFSEKQKKINEIIEKETEKQKNFIEKSRGIYKNNVHEYKLPPQINNQNIELENKSSNEMDMKLNKKRTFDK